MKIKYNEIEQVFEINDNLKIKYYGIYLLNAILILNALIWIVKGNQSNNLTEIYLWLFIGLLSLGGTIFMLLKTSTLSKVPIEKIKSLKEIKSTFGKKRYHIELTNGKRRDLIELKKQEDFDELKNLLSKTREKITN